MKFLVCKIGITLLILAAPEANGVKAHAQEAQSSETQPAAEKKADSRKKSPRYGGLSVVRDSQFASTPQLPGTSAARGSQARSAGIQAQMIRQSEEVQRRARSAAGNPGGPAQESAGGGVISIGGSAPAVGNNIVFDRN